MTKNLSSRGQAQVIPPWTLIAAVVLIAVFLRLPGLWIPIIDIDESQFAGMAHIMMDGGRLYVDCLDTKPPGMYLFYQAVLSVFGRTNMGAMHAVMIIIHVLTALSLYVCGAYI